MFSPAGFPLTDFIQERCGEEHRCLCNVGLAFPRTYPTRWECTGQRCRRGAEKSFTKHPENQSWKLTAYCLIWNTNGAQDLYHTSEYTYYEYLCLAVKIPYLESRYIFVWCELHGISFKSSNKNQPIFDRKRFWSPNGPLTENLTKVDGVVHKLMDSVWGIGYVVNVPTALILNGKVLHLKKLCLTEKDLSNSSFSKPHLHYLEQVIDTPDRECVSTVCFT